jgi:tetratricopeptide (TPR) repeat protein
MKSRQNNLIFFTGFTLLIIFPVSTNSQDFSKGRITDTIKCLNHPDQRYSLYLPASYDKKTKWPVIMIFDPGGNGADAVKVFRIAGERYGYILACSYNSRNGPLYDNFTAVNYMLSDLVKRFNLDEKRVYVSGFSGGSRAALALASLNNFIAGVIGCGAGLPSDIKLNPSGKSSFVYYGIAGNRDMNYLEMFDLMTFFNNNTQVIPYLRTFEGGHQWPSPEIIQEAVEWINIQAMKKRLIVVDSAFILFNSNKIKTFIGNLISAGNQYDAARYMEYAIRDFSGSQVSKEMTKSFSALEQSKDFREANNEWTTTASLERSMEDKYVSLMRQIFHSGFIPDSVSAWWRREIGSLTTMKVKGIPRKSLMAYRLLNFISIFCSEQGSAFYRQEQYDLAGFLFELCTLSDSENMYNYYNLARSLSGSKRKREAINALNKAVELGFTARKTVESEPAFINIKNDERFKSILMRMK